MTFVLSKVGWIVLQPSNLLLLLLLFGFLLLRIGRRLAGRLVIGVVLAILVAVTALPVDGWLARPLENRFQTATPLPASVEGVIVLGGAVVTQLTADHEQPALNDRAERMTMAVTLANTFPDARIVFTGGSGRLTGSSLPETAVASQLFAQLGLSPERFVYEDMSRNTYENAVFSKELVQPKPDETWLLVTSASHMPRSVGVFRRAGWPVVPVPVDYRVPARLVPRLSLGGSLARLDEAAREWVGLVAYRLLGRTDSFYPAPRDQN